METNKTMRETTINLPETKAEAKEKAPLLNTSKAIAILEPPNRGTKKGIAIGDFVLRLCTIGATLGATVTMGNADAVAPFTTRFLRFEAQFNDIPTFVFFMVANGIVTGYLFLSLPFSTICIVRPLAKAPRILLVIFDTAMTGLTLASASAVAPIVYLAHYGNPNTNWLPFCQQFGDFCSSTSGAMVGSLLAGTLLMTIIILSAFALKRN
ncbi:casparian strip membrane protein 2 [Gossypium raimondii]|uniref:CASP-like protein n=1 Tax=Gossypium raimondii TaxID=29730 RepID=A0A0D2RRG2_GOSRA|nr:casparian strip membrane protein 2 [Gossypium raimondii]KJB21715.1 hypothetical protein B456_004G010900 [Gossypium raimondii]